jgi:hypothetical protein
VKLAEIGHQMGSSSIISKPEEGSAFHRMGIFTIPVVEIEIAE